MPGDLRWRIEETCFNAFPSLQQVLFGNWLLRFSAGLSRRANSANPLRPEGADIAANGTSLLSPECWPLGCRPPTYRVIDSPVKLQCVSLRGKATPARLGAGGQGRRTQCAVSPAVR